MKKFILTFIILIYSLLFIPAYSDIVPLSSKSIKYYGIGVINVPENYTVYQYPDFSSKILREVNYENIKKSAIVNTVDMRKISYVAYVPSNKVALLTVELMPGNNWYCVYLDQKTGETGWIYNDNPDSFLTYRGLFYKYGKKYGIRQFSDLSKNEKVLYAGESLDSQKLD